MTTARYATVLTGGGVGALDAKAISTLSQGDICFVSNSGALFVYIFEASRTDAENSPTIIRPNDYASSGVWVLQSPSINTVTLGRRDIDGGDIDFPSASFSNTTFSACSCWDSTGTVWLQTVSTITGLSFGITPAFWSGTNKIADIYLCRLVADGSCEPRMYIHGEDSPDDDPDVDAYRWVDFALVDGSLLVCVCLFYSRGGYHLFVHSDSSDISNSIGTSYATVDHSAFLPEENILAIEYGCRDGVTAATILASDSGTDVSFVVGTTVTTATNATLDAWGAAAAQKAGLKPYNPDRQFKSTSGTLDLLVHQVLLKR